MKMQTNSSSLVGYSVATAVAFPQKSESVPILIPANVHDPYSAAKRPILSDWAFLIPGHF